jgi:hypothetical protein
VPSNTGSGGNKQQEENIVVEIAKGKGIEFEAHNVKAAGFIDQKFDSRDPLPNVRLTGFSGDSAKVKLTGDLELTGVRSYVKGGKNAQQNVLTSTEGGGNKQQEKNLVVESVVGKNNDVEAVNLITEGFVGHVNSKGTLPNINVTTVSGEGNVVRAKGNIVTIGVRSNVK